MEFTDLQSLIEASLQNSVKSEEKSSKSKIAMSKSAGTKKGFSKKALALADYLEVLAGKKKLSSSQLRKIGEDLETEEAIPEEPEELPEEGVDEQPPEETETTTDSLGNPNSLPSEGVKEGRAKLKEAVAKLKSKIGQTELTTTPADTTPSAGPVTDPINMTKRDTSSLSKADLLKIFSGEKVWSSSSDPTLSYYLGDKTNVSKFAGLRKKIGMYLSQGCTCNDKGECMNCKIKSKLAELRGGKS